MRRVRTLTEASHRPFLDRSVTLGIIVFFREFWSVGV
jgi:hypothetical protein